MTASEEILHVRATRFDDWRQTARRLLVCGAAPETIAWTDGRSRTGREQGSLFAGDKFSDPVAAEFVPPENAEPSGGHPFRVPPQYVEMARKVACHRSPRRWESLYRLLWRITGGERKLLLNAADRDVHEVTQFQKAIQRDAHKMKAFVRFRKTTDDAGERYVAWHRPDHYTLELVADFFARRFDVMRWAIMTPDESAVWDGEQLTMGEGMPRSEAHRESLVGDDELEELWKTYYANIFNPARIKLNAMRAEMPKKHWATMPETQLIDDLVRDAPKRVEAMIKHAEGGVTARPHLPDTNHATLEQLAVAAMTCQGCDLHRDATQTVFGRGVADAKLVIVGEQPGDLEDRAGEPFVGPAGKLLREALQEVGLDETRLYVTNAVKHFKFKQTGKRRLHVKPSARDVAACRPWLEAEVAAIKPAMLVCLGATAAGVVFGPGYRLTKERGVVQKTDYARWTMATYHPSALLRVPDETARRTMRESFVADLQYAADHLKMLEETGTRGTGV